MANQQQKYNKLVGKHVLIIGGTSGIGFAVAEASIESGCRVTVSSSSPDKVKSTIQSLTKSYPSAQVSGHACDLSKPSLESDIEALFKSTCEDGSKLDHIVFTAGDSLAMKPISDISLERIQAAGQVRFFAPLLIAKVGSKYLNPGPTSSIVFSTGGVAERPMPNWSTIASYASGLHGMTRNLALDLKPLRVNLVSPGAIDTELWKGMSEEQKAEMFKGIAAKVPTGHVGKPEEVAEAYIYLMKDSNTTGTCVRSDSGASLV